VAGQVAAASPLDGLVFVDANAISPDSARQVAGAVEAHGASYVDGGIIGGPPPSPGGTRVYLSGRDAPLVAGLFGDDPESGLDTVVMSGPPPAASALKMSYAAWTKGTAALVLAVRATARREGVEEELVGWRFVGEMEEIAATFRGAGLPDGFAVAAAEMYRRSPRRPQDGGPPPDASLVLDTLSSPSTGDPPAGAEPE
jgi:hypothetical protein